MFRFTIRDVLWLTVVVALSVSWWIDNKRIEKTLAKVNREQQESTEKLQELSEELQDKITILNDWTARRTNPPTWPVPQAALPAPLNRP